SGSASYNVGLSERRAQAVAAELAANGVPQADIAVDWKGETEPLVPTGDGVREPQNRRAVIELQQAGT
ncbi:MAG TPA: OmpA family protein, partial [Dongiaceae bacterium]|nr:OmpA family protein [Dongiaceae bacterium]